MGVHFCHCEEPRSSDVAILCNEEIALFVSFPRNGMGLKLYIILPCLSQIREVAYEIPFPLNEPASPFSERKRQEMYCG